MGTAATSSAMHFEGFSGAINVSIVAFSIVFIVLFGLTVVIYGMRIFSGGAKPKQGGAATLPAGGSATLPAGGAAPLPAGGAKPAASAAGAASGKIVAAITGAILAASGGLGRVVSITRESSFDASRWTRNWRTSGVVRLVSNSLDRGWRR